MNGYVVQLNPVSGFKSWYFYHHFPFLALVWKHNTGYFISFRAYRFPSGTHLCTVCHLFLHHYLEVYLCYYFHHYFRSFSEPTTFLKTKDIQYRRGNKLKCKQCARYMTKKLHFLNRILVKMSCTSYSLWNIWKYIHYRISVTTTNLIVQIRAVFEANTHCFFFWNQKLPHHEKSAVNYGPRRSTGPWGQVNTHPLSQRCWPAPALNAAGPRHNVLESQAWASLCYPVFFPVLGLFSSFNSPCVVTGMLANYKIRPVKSEASSTAVKRLAKVNGSKRSLSSKNVSPAFTCCVHIPHSDSIPEPVRPCTSRIYPGMSPLAPGLLLDMLRPSQHSPGVCVCRIPIGSVLIPSRLPSRTGASRTSFPTHLPLSHTSSYRSTVQ